jgi:hypothetical protein
VRAPRVVFVVLAVVAAIVVLRGRRRTELVDVQFDDGSSMRLTTGAEARDLLDDACAIVEIAA